MAASRLEYENRLAKCLEIPIQMQKLNGLLRKTEASLGPGALDLDLAVEIRQYNTAHPLKQQMDLTKISDVEGAEKAWGEATNQYEEIRKMLLGSGKGVDTYELEDIVEFKEARKLAREIGRQIEKLWERAKGVAG